VPTARAISWSGRSPALEPFPYRGWALALALRCAREDVARYLLGRGVDLLEDDRREDKYRPVSAYETHLSRHDLTRSSSRLLLNPFGRSVATEVFSPFSGNEQLLGGAFSTTTDIAATCDLVGRLACEGAFDPVVFDDLLRASVAHASDVMDAARNYAPYAIDACLGLAERMIRLWHENGQGGDGADLVLGGFVHRRYINASSHSYVRMRPRCLSHASRRSRGCAMIPSSYAS